MFRRALPLLLATGCPSDPKPTTGETGTTGTDTTTLTDLPTAVQGALGGLRWELPCQVDTTPQLCTTVDTAHQEGTMIGEAGTAYTVTLRFRGVIEPKTYTGGSSGPGWNLGGTPANDTANVYSLTVSDPPAIYYVNAGTTRLGNELWAEAMDVTLDVPMAAGATVSLDAASLDALQIRNVDDQGDPIVVPGVPPEPDAYDGQFVQMDVTGVNAL